MQCLSVLILNLTACISHGVSGFFAACTCCDVFGAVRANDGLSSHGQGTSHAFPDIQELSHLVLETKVWSCLVLLKCYVSPGYSFTSQKENIMVCPCVFGHSNSLSVLNSLGPFLVTISRLAGID